MHPMCEDEIIRSAAEKARNDIMDEEDRKFFDAIRSASLAAWNIKEGRKMEKKFANHGERLRNDGPGMLTKSSAEGLWKAFDKKTYKAHVQGLKKDELLSALLQEAETRYDLQCELSGVRGSLDDTQRELERNKINTDAEIHHWRTAAKHLSETVQSLLLAAGS